MTTTTPRRSDRRSRRSAAATVALVLLFAVALSLAGVAILADDEVGAFSRQYESSVNVSVYLCPQVNQAPCTPNVSTTAAQTKTLRARLAADPRVRWVRYVSAREAYERATRGGGQHLLTVNDLPALFVVALKDARRDYTSFALTYDRAAGVSGVKDRDAALTAVLGTLQFVRLLAVGIAVLVLAAALLLIAGTARMVASTLAAAVGGLLAIGVLAVARYLVLPAALSEQADAGVIPSLDLTDLLVAAGISLVGGVTVAALTVQATRRFASSSSQE